MSPRIIMTVLLAVSQARAGGFAVAEQSASAGGIAGAATARGEDASAAWYNPAALADGAGWRASLGVLIAAPSISSSAPDGSWETGSESRVLTPPHVFVSAARGRWAAGLAVNVPFGAGVTWPEDWQGRFEIVSSRVEVVRVAPFFAWSFGQGTTVTRVGGGVHVDFGRLRLARKLDFVDAEGDVALDLWGTGLGVHAALHHRVSPALALGLSYKSRTYLDLSGDADFTAPDAFSEKIADQGASASVTLPDRFVAGVEWRRDRLAFLADVEVALWGTYDEVVIDFENDQTPDVHNVTNWHTTVSARAGAEWQASPRVRARGGLFVDPSPAPADTLAPTSPDATRIGVTAGAALRVSPTVSVDVFYEYLHLVSRESTSDEALAARYGGHAHLAGLGLRWTR